MTPVIGQPRNETSQPIYQNNNAPSKPTAGRERWCRAEALELQNRLEFLLKPRSLSAVPELDSVGLGEGREFAFLKSRWSRDHALRTRKKQPQRETVTVIETGSGTERDRG